ncbi:nucleoporin subcomplex protein binding to Pom34-domain-containing protein [Microdochium trichocladiopsis]|uniref:Nucleoporin subcomplex protein binding to Pom34-domain-containing protein n=1 Tax=Microdochium trichocladiopsis TaxID=1682393 RepID=A0A9P8YGF5_9PEZI|nr:nucleoporin subcomplex protein binding to Pom34-domain-containing protein [Microdochium trichocladiopsis]KAH7041252.1 nucleoporin subcomplex protein binding to Pom34-domain-containing protein [Microdochium trichocladiopsis]
MAEPLSDDVYLPPLQPCLNGEQVVLSWKLVASALVDTTGHRQSSRAIVRFLTDPYILSLFTKPGSAFDSTSQNAVFVKKTAAIQVPPTPNSRYDIDTIKEDALWLSKNAKINEVAALRIVVVEFQQRPRSQLTGPLSTQDVANLQEALGAQPSNVLPGFAVSSTLGATEIQSIFEKPDNRRLRIYDTYLSERRYYAAVNDYLLTLMLQQRLPTSIETPSSTILRRSLLEAHGMAPKSSLKGTADTPTKPYHALALRYINLLPDIASLVDTPANRIIDDKLLWSDDVSIQRISVTLAEALHRMVVIFQLLDLSSEILVPAELAQAWFSSLRQFSVLDQVNGLADAITDLILPLQCLLAAISVAILNLPRMSAAFEGDADILVDQEFIGSSNALGDAHDAILACAGQPGSLHIAPVLFAWVAILHKMFSSYQERVEKRDAIQNQKAVENYDSNTQMIPSGGRRNSAGSITTIDKRSYDDFLAGHRLDRDSNELQNLAAVAIDGMGVFGVISAMSSHLSVRRSTILPVSVGARIRAVFMELLKRTYDYVGYQSDSVEAAISVLSGGSGYWDLLEPGSVLPQQDVARLALADDEFLGQYFFPALGRFPYEFTPFLSFSRALFSLPSSGADPRFEELTKLLFKTPTITFTLPPSFVDYQLANEDENTNSLEFLDDLPLFTPNVNRKLIGNGEELFIIPAGTFGCFVVDEGRIVRMNYEHSTLALLAKRLEAKSNASYKAVLANLDLGEIAEVISFFATFIRSAVLKADPQAERFDEALHILDEAGQALPHNKDLISIVWNMMDTYLEDEPTPETVAIIAASVQFTHAVLPLCPGRTWSYMAKCQLLSNESRGGRLSRLVGNLDLSDAQFELLTSATRLFSSLSDVAMTSSVRRKTIPKSKPRQKSSEDVWIGVSDRIIEQVSVAIAQATVDILESSSTWRFPTEMGRSELLADLVPIMNKSVLYTFSMGDVASKKTTTAALVKSARYIIDSFLTPSAGSLRLQPLVATLVGASSTAQGTIHLSRTEVYQKQTSAVLELMTNLVRVSNYFDRASTIESQLFNLTPLVARVCAVHDRFRQQAIALLESLVVSAGKSSGEPPSLLGYLGPHTSKAFLQLLAELDRPFDQVEEVQPIWQFFSTIIRNRQPWMANCLLTGKTPREARNGDGKSMNQSSWSVLNSALKRLTMVSKIDNKEALAILDFITSAQNFWPRTIFTLQENNDFLSALRQYVHDLKPSVLVSKTNTLQACNEARIAAYAAEIFAMQLFHLRQLGGAEKFAAQLTNDLDYYLRDGVAVSGYNRSLQATFAKNFNIQYPGTTLESFKRTMLEPRRLGDSFYYATEFADSMLKFDPGWVGPRNNGFRSEMIKANLNLSLVDAQISLYHAWEFLLLELSTCLPGNNTLKKQSLQVAEQCLEANMENQSHDGLFEQLAESRVNLALMLVQRVVDTAPSAGDVAQLLTTLWGTISSVEEPYARDNITSYRTLLKLLYVTLRAQVNSILKADLQSSTNGKVKANATATMIVQTILSIIDNVVAKGFRTLVTFIHDSDTSILPDDVALLTAILQACLCVPGVEQSQTEILNILAAHDAVHVAVSLYSWSDRLGKDGDPVYGELSLLFLLELSALPRVAEQLACDGLLNHLTSANMASYLRRPNVSPFADSIGPQRCYGMWAKGMVPLLLNLLTSLGATIAPEVAYVLNQFPNLMKASVDRFEVPVGNRTQGSNSPHVHITLIGVSEVHSLALMARVLGIYRANNSRDIPAIEWDAAGAQENVEFWLSSPALLKQRLVALGTREAEWKLMPPRRPPPPGPESEKFPANVLEEKVLNQLKGIQLVLSEEFEE